jgi:hypothetical protein
MIPCLKIMTINHKAFTTVRNREKNHLATRETAKRDNARLH